MVIIRNFVGGDREQRFLLPPYLRAWIPENDLAHFVPAAVERVEMGRFKVNALTIAARLIRYLLG